MRLIETSDLKVWAATKQAESRFPYWVKELICAVIQPTKIQFPSGAAVWLPGSDGVLVSNETNKFVPKGLSVWEMGTESRITKKADKDYKKRSGDGDEKDEKVAFKIDRPETTFVFATPLVWKSKNTWVVKRKKEGIWKDVVAIDGVDLQEWFETAPAVSLRFAAESGFAPEAGLQTPHQAWEEWRFLTDPPASEELVLAGRREQEKELIGRLMAVPSTCTIRGDSLREALGFALASLRRVGSDEDRMRLHARTIIVDDEKVAGRLQNRNNLILLLKQAKEQVSGFLSAVGFHVVIPEGTDPRSERNVITLSRPTHYMFREALEGMGLQKEEAEKASRACGRSVTIFQRQKAHANAKKPQWAETQTARNLIPALLAGRWNSESESDQEILCQLAGTDDFARTQDLLQDFLHVDEAPLQKIDEMWTLTAPVDAFELIARHLTKTHLDRFKDAFRAVFGRVDPKVEMPPKEWLYYDFEGEKSHSGWLRSGMAESLLLIAERGADAKIVCIPSPNQYAEEVVKGLPGINDDWRLLASIRDQCARLMEAAPDPFLESLEHLLEQTHQDISCLFAEAEGFGAAAMHTGLLWGLETLAWSPDYLQRVAIILATLARLDPGGRIHNRPINSLREIFLWWHPGTNASQDQRLRALDLILHREPRIGWEVLVKLLPGTMRSLSHPTSKPRWRDFGDLAEDAKSRSGQVKYASAIVDRVLERVGPDPERWNVVLRSLQFISSMQREKALALLGEIARPGTSAEVRRVFWDILRDFIYQHRTFRDAQWALSAEVLDRLEDLLPHLAPDDPVECNKWLFDEWLPEVPSGVEELELRKDQVAELRGQVVQEILKKEGTHGLVRLGTMCKYPGSVAFAAVPLMENLAQASGFVEQAIAAGESGLLLSTHISGLAQQVFGQPWRDFVIRGAKAGSWPPIASATLLLNWPDGRATWEDAAELGEMVAAEYWRRKQVFPFKGKPEDLTYEIDRLIEAGRAAEVFDRTALGAASVPSKLLLQIFDATFRELKRAQSAEEIRRLGLNSYDMSRFLDQLRQRDDIPRAELALREYQALPLLGLRELSGLTIHNFMAEDPTFFVDVLCEIFLPAHRDKNQDSEPSHQERARGEAAFLLLEGMDRIPGRRETGDIDEPALLQWIEAVREKAVQKDRAAIADLHIGKILAHAAEDPEDGGWPHRVVRNVIERLAAKDIERGLMTERRNMRGTYSKGPFEGGAQERAMASQYLRWAALARSDWPRMARVLRSMAQDWEDWARREDVEAEQEKLD